MSWARVLGDAKPSTLESSPQEASDQQRISTSVHIVIIHKVEDDRKDLGMEQLYSYSGGEILFNRGKQASLFEK